MFVRFTTFSIVTMVIMGLTFWLAAARFSLRNESNWPLFYYLLLFGYMQSYNGAIEPSFMYISVVAALLLRFEFLSGFFEKVLRAVELMFLFYVFWRGIALVMEW